jgi:hypothetical protein
VAVWDDAVFLWNPRGDRSYDQATETEADRALTDGSLITSAGEVGRLFNGAVGSRFATPIADLKATSFSIFCVGRLGAASREGRAFGFADSAVGDEWATIWFSNTAAIGSNFRLSGSSSQGSDDWPSVDNSNLSGDTDFHVYVATYTRTDGSNGTWTVYEDSSTATGTDALASASACAPDRLTVGRLDDSSPTNSTSGEVYAAAAWDRALSTAEIDEILANPYGYQETALVSVRSHAAAPSTSATTTFTLTGSRRRPDRGCLLAGPRQWDGPPDTHRR